MLAFSMADLVHSFMKPQISSSLFRLNFCNSQQILQKNTESRCKTEMKKKKKLMTWFLLIRLDPEKYKFLQD